MFKYIFLPEDLPISVPKEMTSFKCLILVERYVESGYRDEVSKALVEAGCLCAMAWGLDCSTWEDSVDCAFLEKNGFGEYPKRSLS